MVSFRGMNRNHRIKKEILHRITSMQYFFFYILGKFSVCGGAPTINAKNFSSLAFLLERV